MSYKALDQDDVGSSQEITHGVSAEELLTLTKSKSSFMEKAAEDMFQFQYQTHVGHVGEVTCIDGNDGMDWILSGGEDCTARLWHYSEQDYQCYRLAKMWTHEDPSRAKVTSVAFAGSEGPVISVTELGDLFVMGITSSKMSRHHQSDTAIVDVRVKREEYKDSGTWLLATATGTTALLTETCPKQGRGTSSEYNFKEIARFPHLQPVLKVMHVPGSIEDGAAIATCSGHSVCLWSLAGQVLHKLSDPDKKPFVSFHIADATSGTGLITGASETVLSFWPIVNGELLDESEMGKPEPIVQYIVNQGIHHVMIDSQCEFFMVQRADMALEYRVIKPADDNDDVVIVPGTDLRLVKPGTFPQSFVIEHTVHCNEMCLRRDDETGPVALLGFKDGEIGTYDLEGADCGEKTSDIRSMTTAEVLSPIVLRFVSFVQVVSFAFGPSTKFSKGMDKPVKLTRSFALMDANVVIDIDPADLFMPELTTVMCLIGAFLLIVLTGTPEKLTNFVNWIKRTKSYGGEVGKCSPYHILVSFLSAFRSLIGLLLGMCSTVLVVPVFKMCAKVVDCEHPADKDAYLSADPHILCMSDYHMQLIYVLAALVPPYFFALIPYAAVGGDSHYMNRAQLFTPTAWDDEARRKATLMYQGSQHPQADSIFITRVVELFSKIALPCGVILTTEQPLLQTGGVAICGLISYITSLLFPPIVGEAMCRVVQGTQLFTFLCMCCGVLTVLCPDSDLPTLALPSSLVFVLVFTCVQVWRAKSPEEKAAAKRNRDQGVPVLQAESSSRLPLLPTDVETP